MDFVIQMSQQPSFEQKRMEVLKYLSAGCWIADLLHKESLEDLNVVLPHPKQHPAFFGKNNPYFYYPDPKVLNSLIEDELLSVHLSTWENNEKYNLRNFRITNIGTQYYLENQRAKDDAT